MSFFNPFIIGLNSEIKIFTFNGSAIEADVLAGKTFYSDGLILKTGTYTAPTSSPIKIQIVEVPVEVTKEKEVPPKDYQIYKDLTLNLLEQKMLIRKTLNLKSEQI